MDIRNNLNGNFELKNSPGISYWGYKNLIDFIRFQDTHSDENEIHIRFNSLMRSIPITTNPDDDGTITAFQQSSLPEQLYKFSITYGNNL